MANVIRTTEKDLGEKKLRKQIDKADGAFVTVGIHRDAVYVDGTPVADVAAINEFGSEDGKIPERSFMRSAIDLNAKKLVNLQASLLQDVINGKKTTNKALESMGFIITILIQNRIKSNIQPKNAPQTLRSKAGTLTLIDSRRMLTSVGYQVTERTQESVKRPGK